MKSNTSTKKQTTQTKQTTQSVELKPSHVHPESITGNMPSDLGLAYAVHARLKSLGMIVGKNRKKYFHGSVYYTHDYRFTVLGVGSLIFNMLGRETIVSLETEKGRGDDRVIELMAIRNDVSTGLDCLELLSYDPQYKLMIAELSRMIPDLFDVTATAPVVAMAGLTSYSDMLLIAQVLDAKYFCRYTKDQAQAFDILFTNNTVTVKLPTALFWFTESVMPNKIRINRVDFNLPDTPVVIADRKLKEAHPVLDQILNTLDADAVTRPESKHAMLLNMINQTKLAA